MDRSILVTQKRQELVVGLNGKGGERVFPRVVRPYEKLNGTSQEN